MIYTENPDITARSVRFSFQRSSRPFLRADTRSSVSSTPQDTRTNPSVMPTFSLEAGIKDRRGGRISGGMERKRGEAGRGGGVHARSNQGMDWEKCPSSRRFYPRTHPSSSGHISTLFMRFYLRSSRFVPA